MRFKLSRYFRSGEKSTKVTLFSFAIITGAIFLVLAYSGGIFTPDKVIINPGDWRYVATDGEYCAYIQRGDITEHSNITLKYDKDSKDIIEKYQIYYTQVGGALAVHCIGEPPDEPITISKIKVSEYGKQQNE